MSDEQWVVYQVKWGKPRADKPGVYYSEKWLVEGYKGDKDGNRIFRQSEILETYDKKSKAVRKARESAKNTRMSNSILRVRTKSGNVSELSRYEREV